MENLSKEHVRRVVNTIWNQLIATTSTDVIGSWGLSALSATQISKKINDYDLDMAALIMTVEGFNFQGKVFVALDEGSDYYRIYFLKENNLEEQRADVGFDELGTILDSLIESGNMSQEEYYKRVENEYDCHLLII